MAARRVAKVLGGRHSGTEVPVLLLAGGVTGGSGLASLSFRFFCENDNHTTP